MPEHSRKPFTRALALENAAFLTHLATTGNARAAADALKLSRSRFTKRRAIDPAFAARWDAALVFANAFLSSPERGGEPAKLVEGVLRPYRSHTADTVPHATRTPSGRRQLRRRPATAITPQAEQAFLAALSATANVRLSARATGFASASFYVRKRTHPAFAREWRLALERGYEQVEAALLASWSEDAHEHDSWRHNDPPPMPPMTANQALQLMYLHQKEARLQAEPPHIKRRRGESHDARSYRLGAMYEARLERDREAFRIAEAIRAERGEVSPHEPLPPPLPDLAQVTGWSRADPAKAAHDETRALFGGWRIEDMQRKKGED